jgi:hypothetical protein
MTRDEDARFALVVGRRPRETSLSRLEGDVVVRSIAGEGGGGI